MTTDREKTLIQLFTELIELGVTYLRQQLKSIVGSSVAEPLRRAGVAAATAMLAATVFGLAVIFIAVGLFLLLAKLVGASWIAFLIVGAVLVLIGYLIAIRGRSANE